MRHTLNEDAILFVSDLESADKGLLHYFYEFVDLNIKCASESTGFQDEKFISRIEEMKTNPEVVMRMSVEHRNGLASVFKLCKERYEKGKKA